MQRREGTAQATPAVILRRGPVGMEGDCPCFQPLRACGRQSPPLYLFTPRGVGRMGSVVSPSTSVCRQLGEEVRGILLGEAFTVGQVTHSVLRAAVQVVGAADGLGEGRVGLWDFQSPWFREQPGRQQALPQVYH